MQGFTILADSYRKAIEQGVLTEEEAQAKIKVYELLGELTQEDLYTLVDSSAFNDIIRSYCREALKRANVNSNIAEAVLDQLKLIYDDTTAIEVCTSK